MNLATKVARNYNNTTRPQIYLTASRGRGYGHFNTYKGKQLCNYRTQQYGGYKLKKAFVQS